MCSQENLATNHVLGCLAKKSWPPSFGMSSLAGTLVFHQKSWPTVTNCRKDTLPERACRVDPGRCQEMSQPSSPWPKSISSSSQRAALAPLLSTGVVSDQGETTIKWRNADGLNLNTLRQNPVLCFRGGFPGCFSGEVLHECWFVDMLDTCPTKPWKNRPLKSRDPKTDSLTI